MAGQAHKKLFALIIGINNYEDNKIPNLKGCVNDSTNVVNFLTEKFPPEQLRIKHLTNEGATRKDILSAFENHLIGNDEINPQDPILFFFAGHGSSELGPKGIMETICPYDERSTKTQSKPVRGIPDRTYDSLMRRLASIKGDNIVSVQFYLYAIMAT